MKKNYDFDKDLILGKRGEFYILGQLKKEYSSARIIMGYFKGYDIDVPEVPLKIECKFDRMSFQTDSIAIEYEYKGEPSGIDATTADTWALIFYSINLGKWVWGLINVQPLKDLCKTKGHNVNGEQDRQSKMYLLKTIYFLNNPYIILKEIE